MKNTLLIANYFDGDDSNWFVFVSHKFLYEDWLKDFYKSFSNEYGVGFDKDYIHTIDIFTIGNAFDVKGKEYKINLTSA